MSEVDPLDSLGGMVDGIDEEAGVNDEDGIGVEGDGPAGLLS